jgi:glycosyltransferase involved in cell wall biosynthesis
MGTTSPPRISVVTPSFNQAQYLEAALESVLGQGYPNLEYFVLDGGSRDGSSEIIATKQRRITYWRSHADGGQAAAINEGFRRATGNIFGWLNSDDLYVSGTLQEIAKMLRDQIDEPIVCYGACELFWEGTTRRELRDAIPFDRAKLEIVDFLDQPSVFWTRAAWETVGALDETLRYAFDWDWFLRARKTCRFISVDRLLSRYRFHEQHKSGRGGSERWKELVEVVRRHSPPEVLRHYEFLAEHSAARQWLNKRVRLRQIFHLFPTLLSNVCADLLSPPFWFLPTDIRREMLWEISGIR